MKYLLLLTSLFLITISCNHKKNDAPTIKGDWIGKEKKTHPFESRLVFSFGDSTCKFYDPYSPNYQYLVIKNIIQLSTIQKGEALKFKAMFKILKLSEDSLILLNMNDKTEPDTINLSKLKQQNTVILSKIYFASSGCYGTCPSMLLKIDSSGKMIFQGRHHTDSIGFYSTFLKNDVYKSILKRIQNLPLDSLKKRYEANWTDDQTCGINIISGNKEYYASVYGYDKEPIELRILLNELMALYKHVDLKKDTSIPETYFSENEECKKIIFGVLPLPPPFIN